jgi:hypothetical protein
MSANPLHPLGLSPNIWAQEVGGETVALGVSSSKEALHG